MIFITICVTRYFKGVRDIDRNLLNIPGTINSFRAVLCSHIFAFDLFVLNRKLVGIYINSSMVL